MPAEQALTQWYSQAYFDRHYGGERDGAERRCTALLAAAEARLGRRGRLLDVGCGVGDLCVAADRAGWEAVGLEPAKSAAERARARGVEVIVSEAAAALSDDGACVPRGPFDLVVFHDALPHVRRAGDALCGAARRLCAGGWLLIRVPNRHPGVFRMARWAARITDASGILHLPAQVLHLDRPAVAAVLAHAGLSDIRVEADTEAVRQSGGRYSRNPFADHVWRACLARWERRGEPEVLLGWGRRP